MLACGGKIAQYAGRDWLADTLGHRVRDLLAGLWAIPDGCRDDLADL